MEHPRPASHKMPAGLAGVLNPSEENRDSAYYSSTDNSSKHTSTASYHGVNGTIQAPQSDKTPSPTAPSLYAVPAAAPTSTNMSVASMMAPSTPGSVEQRRIDRPFSIESGRTSTTGGLEPHDSISRRESVDSRMNQDFAGIRLATSPYTSHNHSTTSIHNSLHQQRHPRAGVDSLSLHRISNGYQPSAERNPDPQAKGSRTAPTITGPATSHIARAAEPTKGQAWAFPEEEAQRMPASVAQSLNDSRRSSIADSLASSQFTSESRLPPGQRRLDDGAGSVDYQRMSAVSGEYPVVHHHTLQHRSLDELQDDDLASLPGSQPYSRTPELRVSHKLAERKRRTEMKELFEQLRDLMPQDRGSKASKWEILTKAIAEHQRQSDTIKYLQQGQHSALSEVEILRREVAGLRMENSQLRSEPTHYASGQPVTSPDGIQADNFARNAHRPELPPLRSLSGSISAPGPGADSMTGVQYDSRPSGYRGPEGRF